MVSDLTDCAALERHRLRAGKRNDTDFFLHREAAAVLEERLGEVNRAFTAPTLVTAFNEPFANLPGASRHVTDADVLDLQPGAHDLVVHAMGLHWASDPLGQIIQCRRALTPDGLFLAVAFGGRTLHELRAVLAEAEASLTGGLSPRVAPMADIRDLGALLQRAGLAMPVADTLTLTTSYPDLFAEANRLYSTAFPAEDGRVAATFELVFLTGWAPDESQPKPLRPGSANARLAEALATKERPAGDIATPRRD